MTALEFSEPPSMFVRKTALAGKLVQRFVAPAKFAPWKITSVVFPGGIASGTERVSVGLWAKSDWVSKATAKMAKVFVKLKWNLH